MSPLSVVLSPSSWREGWPSSEDWFSRERMPSACAELGSTQQHTARGIKQSFIKWKLTH